jgi:hypothetical protein
MEDNSAAADESKSQMRLSDSAASALLDLIRPHNNDAHVGNVRISSSLRGQARSPSPHADVGNVRVFSSYLRGQARSTPSPQGLADSLSDDDDDNDDEIVDSSTNEQLANEVKPLSLIRSPSPQGLADSLSDDDDEKLDISINEQQLASERERENEVNPLSPLRSPSPQGLVDSLGDDDDDDDEIVDIHINEQLEKKEEGENEERSLSPLKSPHLRKHKKKKRRKGGVKVCLIEDEDASGLAREVTADNENSATKMALESPASDFSGMNPIDFSPNTSLECPDPSRGQSGGAGDLRTSMGLENQVQASMMAEIEALKDALQGKDAKLRALSECADVFVEQCAAYVGVVELKLKEHALLEEKKRQQAKYNASILAQKQVTADDDDDDLSGSNQSFEELNQLINKHCGILSENERARILTRVRGDVTSTGVQTTPSFSDRFCSVPIETSSSPSSSSSSASVGDPFELVLAKQDMRDVGCTALAKHVRTHALSGGSRSEMDTSRDDLSVAARDALSLFDHTEGCVVPISTLSLDGNHISAEGACAILEMIEHVPVTTLSLADNHIGLLHDPSSSSSYSSSYSSSSLSVNVHASRHAFHGHSHFRVFCELLRSVHVAKIDLRHNSIDSHHCVSIAEALTVNPHVSEIDLRGNNVAIRGAHALLDCIQKNQNIGILHLEDTRLHTRTLEALSNALERNRALRREVKLQHEAAEGREETQKREFTATRDYIVAKLSMNAELEAAASEMHTRMGAMTRELAESQALSRALARRCKQLETTQGGGVGEGGGNGSSGCGDASESGSESEAHGLVSLREHLSAFTAAIARDEWRDE